MVPPGARPAITFGAWHAIGLVVGQASDGLELAVCKIVQLLFAHAVDAAVAAQPEPAVIVLEDLKDAVVEQPVFGGVACEPPVLEPSQPAVIGADPQRAVAVQF